MNWKELQQEIYFKDGSLRDIYIYEIAFDDWVIWSNMVHPKNRAGN